MDAPSEVGFVLTQLTLPLAVCALLLQPLSAQGAVSLPVDHKLAELLQDAELLLEQGDFKTAIQNLRAVARANPSAVIEGSDPTLRRGAAATAQARLHNLMASDLAESETAIAPSPYTENQANEALQRALTPPSREALARLIRQFPGTRAATQAKDFWHQLALDRGSIEAGPAPRDWPSTWRTQDDTTYYNTPFVAHGQDAKLPMISSKGLRSAWSFDFRSNWFSQNHRHRILSRGDKVWASDGVELTALSLATGKPIWSKAAPASWRGLNELQLRSLNDAVDSDFLHTPVLSEGVLLMVLQEGFTLGRKDDFRRDISVRRSLPARRLYAFDAESGQLLWVQKVPWMTADGQPLASSEAKALVAGPPAVSEGRVFLPVYNGVGTFDVSLLALDLHTGQELWKTFLVSGVKETNLFGNILLELACPPPVANLDTVFLTSNLGAVSAVDAATGTTLWTRTYLRAPLRTYQSGRESERALTFTLDPPALGEAALVVAPSDGKEVLSIHPQTGDLLHQWPAVSNGTLMRQLHGASPKGIWFSGVQAGFAAITGAGAQSWTSSDLFDHYWRLDAIHGGLLARGLLIANSPLGLLGFHAITGQGVSTLFQAEQLRSLGDFQVFDGHLFALRAGGFDVLRTHEGLLLALQDEQRALFAWPALLDLFIDFDFSKVPQAWVRHFSDSLQSALENYPQFKVEPTLSTWHLVAGRVAITLGDTDAALEHFDYALVDKKSARIVLSALLAQAPTSETFEHALQLLNQSAPDAARVAQAKVIRAITEDNPEEARKALVQLLLLDSTSTHHSWAREHLDKVLQRQQQAHENDAKQRLAGLSTTMLSAGFLRAFGQTQIVSDALMDHFQTDLLDGRIDDILSARAVQKNSPELWKSAARELGEQAVDALLSESMHLAPDGERLVKALPNLSREFETRATGALPRAQTIALRLNQGRVLALTQTDTGLQWFTEPSNWSALGPILPHTPFSSTPEQHQQSLPTEKGQLLFSSQKLVHFGFDHSVAVTPLDGPIHFSMPPLNLGRLCSFFTRDSQGELVLEIHDKSSGQLWLKRDLHLSSNTHVRRIHAGRYLFLVMSRQPQALRIDLLGIHDDAHLPLPFIPAAHQLASIGARGGGLLLPQNGKVIFVQVQQTQTFPEDGLLQALPFSARHGHGWLLRPLIPGAGNDPAPSLAWWPRGKKNPQITAFQEPQRAFPQLQADPQKGVQPVGEHLFSFVPRKNGSTQLDIFELSESQIKRSHALDLPELTFSELLLEHSRVHPLRDGWLISIPVASEFFTTSSKLLLLRIDAEGKLTDRWESALTPTPDQQRRVLISGQQILVLEGETLHLLY